MTTNHHIAPISATDRVSDVLARDEALVDVFTRLAPHFAKLRNRAMRRVMARLVTVEQAAHTANVPVEQLVHDLNAAIGLTSDASAAVTPAAGTGPVPRHPSSAPVIELDVREDLRAGREPFSRIMYAVRGLADSDVLHLRTTFEPVPLFAALAKRGLVHESEAHAPDDWSAWFWRPDSAGAHEPIEEHPQAFADAPHDDERTTWLDVRGYSPPEPMMQTLVALESLARGHTLVQINNRVPQFLLPVLAERGFAWQIDESRPDRVLVRIWHSS